MGIRGFWLGLVMAFASRRCIQDISSLVLRDGEELSVHRILIKFDANFRHIAVEYRRQLLVNLILRHCHPARLADDLRESGSMKKIALSLLVIAASGTYVWEQSGRRSADDLLASAPTTSDAPAADIEPRATTQTTLEQRAGVQSAALVNTLTDEASVSPQAAEPSLPGSPVVTSAAAPPIASSSSTATDASPTGTMAVDAPATSSAQISDVVDVPLPRLRPTSRAARAKATPLAQTASVKTLGYSDGTYTGPVTDAYYGLIQIQATIQGGRLAGINVLKYPSDRRTSVAINHQALPMLRSEVVAAQSAKVDIISGATLTSEAFIKSLGGALRQAAS